MTIREARKWGRSQLAPLAKLPIPARVDIDILARDCDAMLAIARGCSREVLIAELDSALSAPQEELFRAMVSRRRQEEPLAYILGHSSFHDIELRVSRDVLIPRPETEQLVEIAIAHLRSMMEPKLLDIGTGSGAIPLAICAALHKEGIEIEAMGCDVCEAALTIAKENAEALGFKDRVSFACSDLLQGLAPAVLSNASLLTANLPYVAAGAALPRGVSAFEPELALRAGEQGLDCISRLLRDLSGRLPSDAVVLLEIGHDQGGAVECLAREARFKTVNVYKDFQGLDRVAELMN